MVQCHSLIFDGGRVVLLLGGLIKIIKVTSSAVPVHLAADLIGDPQPVLVHLVLVVDCQVVQQLVGWSYNAKIIDVQVLPLNSKCGIAGVPLPY